VQFPLLRTLMGGYDKARVLHFCGDERAGRVLCRPRRDGRACAALAAFDDSRAVEMIFRQPTPKPETYFSVRAASIIKDACNELKDPVRRLLGKRILTLGGLAMLSGSDLPSDKSVNPLLRRVTFFNDLLFDPNKTVPTYPGSMVTRPFSFNAFYDIDDVPEVDASAYRLQLGGLANGKRTWTLDELRALPQESQITRHICIEGWSVIGRWGGVRFANLLRRAGADTTAKYVSLLCADNYWKSIDMLSALHARKLLTVTYDGQLLPPKCGFPMRVRMPTKLGYKNPKHIVAITVTNEHPGGYWETRATTSSAVPDGITILLIRETCREHPCLSA
jgi:DMSO/TMAO reductase YedYZ molybdopterin-dependent catalytic subunit